MYSFRRKKEMFPSRKPYRLEKASILHLLSVYTFVRVRIVISFPESSLPLTIGRKSRDSGSNHFEITKEMTEFCLSGFTAQSAFIAHAWNGCS